MSNFVEKITQATNQPQYVKNLKDLIWLEMQEGQEEE